MAAVNPVQSLQEEATCSVCLEYFKDPVTTKCGHNFCRPCVSACSQGMGSVLTCPQCREVSPRRALRANRQLQSIVELVKQLSVQQERPPGEGLCAEHEERLKLFCMEDERLICLICRESREHTEHKVQPIKEAAEEYEPKLQKWLQTLRGELEAVQQGKLKEEEDCKAMRNKLEAERRIIETEFQRLQQLLKEQEQTLLRRLQEMDKKVASVENANITKLSAEMSSLEALITEIEKKCEQPAEGLLKDIRSTLNRCKEVMDQTPARDAPGHVSKSTDVNTSEGCQWSHVKKYKVHVMLDEDTASDWLALSEGGRRVRHTDRRQRRPDLPKRFTDRPGVLGREGFTSGRHYWELQLLLDGFWFVGVMRESVCRKGGTPLSREAGVWAVRGWNGLYSACTSPLTPLTPRQCPVKLGVYLDYEGGQLSVYNADTMEALHTFTRAAFSGRVCPFFWVGESADLRLV